MASVDCPVLDPACLVEGAKDAVGGAIGAGGTALAEGFVNSLAEGMENTLTAISTFWIALPSPSVENDAIRTITDGLGWYTYAFAVVGILLALLRMAQTNELSSGLPAVKMIFNLILVTGAYAVGFTALIKASDAFAPWIIEKATGQEMTLSGMLSASTIMTTGIGPAMLIALVGFLASLANVVFMVLRGAMITILFAFLPILAASSGSEAGSQAFKKASGYLLAFVLFKPVAAVIYALGFLMVKNPPAFQVDDIGKALYQSAVAVMIITIAFLCLPALIKFIVPVAAQGSSAAFSGAAAGAAVVAGGAAIVTMGATAGAGAAAGGAPAAGGASGGAAMGGGSAAAGSGGAAAGGSAVSGGQAASTAGSGGQAAAGLQAGGRPASGGSDTGAGAAGGASSSNGGSSSADSGQAAGGARHGGGGGDTARAVGDMAAAGGAQSQSAIDDASEESK
jgi:type IV secretion system protein TrbL